MNTIGTRRTTAALVSASALAAFLVAGCAGWPGSQGDPGAPIVVRGTVFNKYGVPYSGADLVLQVVDAQGEAVVQGPTLVLNARFTSSFDGTFDLHVAPSRLLSEEAARNGGSVRFKLVASYPGESAIPPARFSREVAGSGWAGPAPVVELHAPPPPPTPAPAP